MAHGAPAAGLDLEGDGRAEKRQRLPAVSAHDRRPRQAGPLVQLALDPALLLPQERLDFAPRRAQRRGHGKPVGVDGDADGAPAAAHETVVDAASAKVDQVSAFCCSSIHCSAIALRTLGSRFALSIGGPMRTVTVPGCLMKALRGQTRPALCATGTIGAPLAAASHAPPSWYVRRSPGATRVPSGKTTTQKPWSSRSRPRRAMLRSALTPRERSIGIGLISASPQPKNGIQSSSRLRTCTCGGKICWKASVSQADWCLDRITAGQAGRCSWPSTFQSMPSSLRARNSTTRDQPE